MCSYDGSGSWPQAVAFLLLGLSSIAATALPRLRASRPWTRASVTVGSLFLLAAVWAFLYDPFTNPKPCS
jgi:hypothetical protein